MATTKQEQYRPSFTLAELEDFLLFLPENCPAYKKLAVYVWKVRAGVNAAAFSTSPKASLVESLGFTAQESEGNSPQQAPKSVAKVERVGSDIYSARLAQRASIAPETLTAEDRYNLLAGKAFAGEPLTEEELLEGQQLEAQLYQMDMGTFSPKEQPL